jgi:hypothetical protein
MERERERERERKRERERETTVAMPKRVKTSSARFMPLDKNTRGVLDGQ